LLQYTPYPEDILLSTRKTSELFLPRKRDKKYIYRASQCFSGNILKGVEDSYQSPLSYLSAGGLHNELPEGVVVYCIGFAVGRLRLNGDYYGT
jgi:hypothetical protein